MSKVFELYYQKEKMPSLNKSIIENFFKAQIFRLVYYHFDNTNIHHKPISTFKLRYR